ncbi:MAG: helix-turn-helix domain-containing protein [Blastocatellia bacterium]|nr:helix-turn-helix domain-containing protein [Blastocatellia bacterium]
MQKAFKYRIETSVVDKLEQTLEICRELYNAALQERREAYQLRGKTISYVMQANQLPAIKYSPAKLFHRLLVVQTFL